MNMYSREGKRVQNNQIITGNCYIDEFLYYEYKGLVPPEFGNLNLDTFLYVKDKGLDFYKDNLIINKGFKF